MNYDVLILGAGAAGMSCALVLGSAGKRPYVSNKKIGLIAHQKSSHLQNALFNNVLGLEPGTTGASLLDSGLNQIKNLYPHIDIIKKQRAISIVPIEEGYLVSTNKSEYNSRLIVIALGYTDLINLKGIEQYIESHPRTVKEKNRIWLRNNDHLVTEGMYVAGTLAGWRSQFAMAAGSGSHVATDILTLWNGGTHTKVHDKVPS